MGRMTDLARVRLQKYLADRGIASRRECERLIAEGRVRVNGALTSRMGVTVDPAADTVVLDGVAVSRDLERRRTLLLNKPPGYVCSASARQGRSVCELLGAVRERLVPVGRLDKDSEGLLLMSNDGQLALTLTHPRFEHEKAYAVTVAGAVSAEVLSRLRAPFTLDGSRTRPARVSVTAAGRGTATALEFILREGRNRQIRRMCEEVGLRVLRIVRTRVGTLTLGRLRPGEWRELSESELRQALSGAPGAGSPPPRHRAPGASPAS
jgi:pseudouridine synthase